MMETNIIHCGDALEVMQKLPDKSINCCITSPPYWGLRDYKVEGQIGLEKTPKAYVARMTEIFREVRRVLRDDGTLWLNLGDSYCGASGDRGGACTDPKWKRGGHLECAKKDKPKSIIRGMKIKDLIGIPWMVAFALRADGWYLRQDIIWHKPNPMPESVTDRCTKAHEYIFLLAKSKRYYYDAEAMKEEGSGRIAGNKVPITPRNSGAEHAAEGHGIFAAQQRPCITRNRRSVWTITPKPYRGAHFATFPEALVKPCILAGCPEGGIVLDPFVGSGTTGMVAKILGRKYIGIELNPEYVEMANRRIAGVHYQPSLFEEAK